MYIKGMTTGDIEAHIQDSYGIFISDSTVGQPDHRQDFAYRQGMAIAASGFDLRRDVLDAIHYHVRSKG